MNELDNDFADIEAKLRSDLGPLADALLAGAEPVPVAAMTVGRSRRWLVAMAAAAVALVAAIGIWQVADNDDRIETGPITPGPEDLQSEDPSLEEGQPLDQENGHWIDLPSPPDGVRSRGHMLSVWTGDEALFWGGRSGGDIPEAYVGGVAYNPATDSWREIMAPPWGHPGGTGAYLDGRVYVTAKGSVTRFDPDSGEEEEISVDRRLSSSVLADDGSVVVAFGPAAGGFGYQVVGPDQGELQVIEGSPALTEALAPGGEIKALGWAPGEFGFVLPDLSAWSLSIGSDFTRRIASPAEPGYHRVELADTADGPLVVHLQGEGEQITLKGLLDGSEWGLAGGFDDFRTATVVGAGEWVVLVQADSSPVGFAIPNGAGPALVTVPVDPPLGTLNPNVVWSGQEVVVWGGNPKPVADQAELDRLGGVGGRIRLPDPATLRENDPDPDGGAAEDTAAAAEDETEFQVLQRLVDQLPAEQRIPAGPYDESGNERFDHQWTAEGLWVYSRPEPSEPGPAMDAGEILLLEDWGGPIIESWLLGYFPGGYGGQIEVADDAVYCAYAGDGGLPDSLACRLDRTTGELALTIFTTEPDGGDEGYYRDLYDDSEIDWRVVSSDDEAGIGRPFGSLYLEGEAPTRPVMVNATRLVRLDPETLTVIAVDDVQPGGRRYPCPHEGDEVPTAPDFGLPAAVEATRLALLEAAATCDAEALEALSGGLLSVPSRDGGWGMVALAAMLTTEPEVVVGGPEEAGQNVYLFPSSAAGVSRTEFQALSRFYGPDGDDHLTIILEEGTWQVTTP